VCFELIKMTVPSTAGLSLSSDYIQREHVQNYVEKMINQNEQMVHSFYAKTELDPRLPIKRGKMSPLSFI
jgi:hypothetical protein